ncbi:MAG TPA: indolepyruvate oxidoreductase subunit beta [Polyangiaceae bacterium]
MATTKNILIAAVGGQGALLAARVFGSYAAELQLDVKVSEIHGMSQRGGSVVTHVRFGDSVASPVIETGTADVVMAFELLEAARYIGMLKRNGLLIVSNQRILPLPVLTGKETYPVDLLERMTTLPIRVLSLDAMSEAQALGNIRTVNTILLGAYAKQSGAAPEPFRRAVMNSVRDAHREVNLTAFERGFALASEVNAAGSVAERN